jgi:hypothetical protein
MRQKNDIIQTKKAFFDLRLAFIHIQAGCPNPLFLQSFS